MKPITTKVYTDAGWKKWNEAPIYLASRILMPDEEPIDNAKVVNDIAYSSVYVEYVALIWALKYCLRIEEYSIEIFNDNQTMVRQVQGLYKVKTDQIKPLWETVEELWDEFDHIRIKWIPRKENQADRLIKDLKK